MHTTHSNTPSGGGRSLGAKVSGRRGRPPAIILIPLERQLTVLQICRWHFLYNETLQQTFRLYCRNCPKDDTFRYFIHIFKKVRGGVEPWLMARWKACVEFLFSVIGLRFLSLTVEALQGKMCQDSLLLGGGRSVQAKISGEGVVPGEYFLVSTKPDTFCYPTVQTAPCYVPSF